MGFQCPKKLEIFLSGLPEKMEIVDLDEHVVVGCDLEMVKRIETEVYKARCRRHAYADQMKKRLESREPVGDERQSDLDLIEPHPRDEVERKENLDFLDDSESRESLDQEKQKKDQEKQKNHGISPMKIKQNFFL